jgi:hypothetical protein
MQWPSQDSIEVVRFVVLGEPKPAGSKVAQVVYVAGKDGARRPLIKDGRVVTHQADDSGQPGQAWRTDVRAAVAAELGDNSEALLDAPLAIETRFFCQRPVGHFGADGNVKASQPRYPHRRKMGDGTKLLRAVEDALNEFLFTDDKRIVRGLWTVDYGRPRAEVIVWRLPETVGEAQRLAVEHEQLVMSG